MKRIADLGGELKVQSNGHGTVLTATIPLPLTGSLNSAARKSLRGFSPSSRRSVTTDSAEVGQIGNGGQHAGLFQKESLLSLLTKTHELRPGRGHRPKS